jgi:hypothetical protein
MSIRRSNCVKTSSLPIEGYVFHTYGPERYVVHAVASVHSLRRYDSRRPIALFCPPEHRRFLEEHGVDDLFQVLEDLPSDHRSIVGFKHHLDRFHPFDRCLYVDSDMIWCRNPDPLWRELVGRPFTATGLERADFFFGGPKGAGVIVDILLNRRERTLRRFDLTYLPRVQAGMIYSQDVDTTSLVCATARFFLGRRHETHFRSRLDEGRSEESCEWSLAMAVSRLNLPVFPWMRGPDSPQLDYIEGLVEHDEVFENVRARFYTDRFVYGLRGIPNAGLRSTLIKLASSLPGRGDYQNVVPFTLHFGWLHQKQHFNAYVERVWEELRSDVPARIHAAV